MVKTFKTEGGEVAAVAETPAAEENNAPANGPSADVISKSLHAAAVTWLGNEVSVEPPRDIEAWVIDKDLTESTRQSLEVRLLLTKAQLDSISSVLKSVIEEMNTEIWESWGPDEPNDFLNNLEAKRKAYAAIHDDTSMWIPLNPGDDANDYVAPILLDLMP